MPLDLDPGTAALGNPRLIQTIVEEMAGGAIPFERFMELALYHPEHGYYRKAGRVGRQGDFLTSPVIHPLFGWAVGAWCRDTWERLGRPANFTIFEPAAGAGALAAAILDWAEGRDDGFREAIRYVAIEPNSPGSDGRVEWAAPPVPPAPNGVVVTNELFDAFPVRLFDGGPRGPVEVFVRLGGERFVEQPGGIASIDDAPAEGRFEVNPRAYPAMRSLCPWSNALPCSYRRWRHAGGLWAPCAPRHAALFLPHTAHEDHISTSRAGHHTTSISPNSRRTAAMRA